MVFPAITSYSTFVPSLIIKHNIMYTIPHTHTEDINQLQSAIREYGEGRLDEDSFKAARTPMGIYEQRKDKTYLVRVRCVGGYISPAQLQGLAEIAQEAEVPYFHITTRQEIQFHYVTLPWVKPILEAMERLGLSSKGGGGNTVRNILVDIRAGIDTDEVFDVYPYAVDLTSFLIAQEDSFTLPRKLKIAFDISEEKADYALINDLGFIPRIVDGKKGFKVYVGGSVASKPTTGWLIYEFIPEEELLHIAYAVKRFFSEHGDRKNRHSARIRHIFYRLGEEETIRLIRQYAEQVKAENKFPYTPSEIRFQSLIPKEKPVLPDYTSTFERWKKKICNFTETAGIICSSLTYSTGNHYSGNAPEAGRFCFRFRRGCDPFYHPSAHTAPEYSGELSAERLAAFPGIRI